MSVLRAAAQALLRGWQPLSEPIRGLEEMRTWKALLTRDAAGGVGGGSGEAGGGDDPYSLLVWEVVLPAVRSAALNAWQPREPEPLLTWLEVGGGERAVASKTNAEQ